MSDHNQGSTLFNWDVKKEQQKADFMEHLLMCIDLATIATQVCGNGFV
jgi:hypothetical protein